MKDSLKNKLTIFLLVILYTASISIAFYRYFAGENAVKYWEYLSEIFLVGSLFVYYRLIQRLFDFEHKTIQENLQIFTKLLAAIYLIVIVSKLIFSPAWSDATLPHSPDTISTVIYDGLTTFLAIVFFIPMLLIIKKLIFYKRKKSTTILIPLLLIFTLAGIFSSVITEIPLNIGSDGDEIYNSIALIGIVFYPNSFYSGTQCH